MKGQLVTIFGGAGFIGTSVVEHLAKSGCRIRVVTRRPNNALHVKPLGELGQIQLVQANLRNKFSVEAAVKGSDIVINLVGLLFESGSQTFQKIHVEGATIIAEASSAAGVKQLVHLSAIGADAESPSLYAQSKAAGEATVIEKFPHATIIRSSVVFGPDDQFFNKFGAMAKSFPFLPVISGDTKMQPVYVGDLAMAIEAILKTKGASGNVYEFGGPRIYSFRELLELIIQVTQQNVALITVPMAIAKFKAFFLGMMPNPIVTLDQLRLMAKDNVVSKGAKGFKDLKISPTPVEAIIPSYLVHYRPKGQFND
jgi:uncharacterized protein YbjT (DUF2867 family)